MEPHQATYRFDLAKGPTKCHGCDDLIEVGCGRVGCKKEGQRYFDFFHVAPCFPDKHPHKDIRSVPGFMDSTQAIQDTTLHSPKKDVRLVREDDRFGVADHPVECEGCGLLIWKSVVHVRHFEVANQHQYSLFYHVPCWLKPEAPRPYKPLWKYDGFRNLAPVLQAKVRRAKPDSAMDDICQDPSAPLELVKPEHKDPPKRCLAQTRAGTRCRWSTNSKHPLAEPLNQDGRFTCQVHEGVHIDQAAIDAYERERKVAFGRKQFQYFDACERNQARTKKRARTTY